MGVKTTLPSYELGFYALAVTCAVLYSGSGIFEASRGNVPPLWGSLVAGSIATGLIFVPNSLGILGIGSERV